MISIRLHNYNFKSIERGDTSTEKCYYVTHIRFHSCIQADHQSFRLDSLHQKPSKQL